MIRKNDSLKEVFPGHPMAGLRQPPNLRRTICRARLYQPPSDRPTRHTRNKPGWKPCAGYTGQCPVCPYVMAPTSVVTGLASGYQHQIADTVNCQSENCLYYWRCNKFNCKDYPNCEYVGKTTKSFQQRFSQHRDYFKRGVTSEPSGEHFSGAGHSVADMKGCVLEVVKSPDPYILKAREHLLIRKFDTYRAGLNRER